MPTRRDLKKMLIRREVELDTIKFPPSGAAPLRKPCMVNGKRAKLQLSKLGFAKVSLQLYKAREELIGHVARKTHDSSNAREKI